MMRRKTGTMFFFLLLSYGWAAGQDVRADLQRLRDKMAQNDKLRQELTYTVYKGHAGDEVLETHRGTYARQGNAFRLEIGESLTIQDGKHHLLIDPDMKALLLTHAQPVEPPSAFDIDKWLSVCEHTEVLKARGGLHGYRLKFYQSPFAELASAEIWVDSATGLLAELVLYYAQEQNIGETMHNPVWVKPRLRIAYSKTETNPVFQTGTFSMTRFLVFRGEKAELTAAYKTWTLNDLRSPK